MNEKMKKLREEFAVLDKNGSGNISLTEMKAAIEKKAQYIYQDSNFLAQLLSASLNCFKRVFFNVKNGLSFITSKSSSKNFSFFQTIGILIFVLS